MLKGWLKNMLPPAKQDSDMWMGWVDVMQQMLGENVETIIERIDARKSLFSMKGEDLDTRVNELGRFFSIRSKNEASKPILLSQRIDEIHFKGTDRPITSTFWREFENIPAHWEPLYAPIDQAKAAYGDFFTTGDGIGYALQQYGKFFMTSRGKIALSINALYQQYGPEKQADLVKRIQSQFEEIIQPLLPLDIVFDGFLLYLDYTLIEYAADLVVKDLHVDMKYAASTWITPTSDFSFSIQSVIPSQELVPAIRSQDFTGRQFNITALDTWPLGGDLRPAIYQGGSKPDNRLRTTATGIEIDTMGAYAIRVLYSVNSEYEDYLTGGVAVLPISMSALRAGQILQVTYSLT